MQRKKLFTKIIVIAMTTMMTAGLFSGCGKSEEEKADGASNTNSATSGKVSDEPITFTMLYADNSAYPFNKDWDTLKEMEKITNVHLNVQSVPDGDYSTKRQLILNSGEMPDIISKTQSGDISDYALNGVILPISDYLDKMPNFKAFIEKYDYKQDIENMKESDGKFYSLPVNANTEKIQTELFMVRKDILDKNGLKVPTTLDELYETAKALKAKYPDSTPIINEFGMGNIMNMVAPAFNTSAGWGAGPAGFTYDKTSNKWLHAPTSDQYKQMLQYFNKLYTEGLLDKEFATASASVFGQKKLTDKGFIFADWIGTEGGANAEGKKTNPDFNIEPIMTFKGVSGKSLLPAVNMYSQGWVLPASVKDKPYFDTLLRFVDWFYSDEAANLFTWGVKGISYNETNGKKEYVSDVKDLNDASKKFGVNNNNLTVVRPFEWVKGTMGEATAKIVEQVTKENGIAETRPSLKLASDEREEEKLVRQTLQDYTDQMTQKFIYGNESFDNWDKYVQECDKKGRQTLSELYNKAWQRQNTQK